MLLGWRPLTWWIPFRHAFEGRWFWVDSGGSRLPFATGPCTLLIKHFLSSPVHLRDLSNYPMDAMMPTSSNANPSTASDVRSRPISNDPGRCSEQISGPYLKDKFTPRKSSRNAKRQNMVININGYKRWVRKCRKRSTYGNNLRILCQGREDNPLHTDAFNELIENLKRKKSNMEYNYG